MRCWLVIAVIFRPRLSNTAVSSFLSLSQSLPDLVLITARPSSRYNLTFLFTWICALISLLILSRMDLLTLPGWLFAGLMRRHLGWFSKSCLWSFNYINAGFSFIGSIRLDIFKSPAIDFSSWLISFLMPSCARLYVFVTFSVNSLL